MSEAINPVSYWDESNDAANDDTGNDETALMESVVTRCRSADRRTLAELKAASAMLARIRRGEDVRRRKARRIGAAVRARRYENALKLDIAIDRLLDELLDQ